MSDHGVVVIGAGIMGLSTAVQILEMKPSLKVKIVADKFNTETVSDGAAGNFRPTADLVPGVPRDLLKRWCADSWNHYDRLAHSPEAGIAGVGPLTVYHCHTGSSKPEKDCIFKEFVYNFKECSNDEIVEMRKLFNGLERCNYAQRFTTLIVEGRFYLPYLMKKFLSLGGTVERRKVSSINEFYGTCDVLVNCSSLGSRELFADKTFAPTRGHMIRVKAPWIKQAIYVNHNTWIIPGQETVTVGGTRQADDDSPEIRADDSRDVWERACNHIPSLRGATWQWQWVGIRPIRRPVRIERQSCELDGKSLQVVHNYGHGGNGIALSWGCSKHAARLTVEALQEGVKHSKL